MLASGTRLGPYEVIELVGEGGMGQVFKARDTRLDRTVAIKMLPAALATDAVRRERFEREARNVSRLEHPNICPLYDVGEHEGHLYLVMQFLEGETLADVLRNGPLPIKQSLDYGVQIAEALAAAHRADIVHRDLKPGNVMITRTGVRLLDFGLARNVPSRSASETIAADRTGLRNGLTTEGTILGTLAYMAPEQIDGRETDTRADVFAFGAVLFEMVTGLKAFDGESPARVMSAILRDEPARVSSIAPVTPAALEALIHACLAKDPHDRWQNIADVARQLRHLRDMMSGSKSEPLPASAALPATLTRRRAQWAGRALPAGAAIAMIAAAFVVGRFTSGGSSTPAVRLHAALLPPAGLYLTDSLALSPDAQRLAFITADATGQRQLWVRTLASGAVQPVAGTIDASDPFWSPDGQHLAFFSQRQLKRVPVGGGAVTTITDIGDGAGGSWNADDVIVVGRLDGPLMRVSATGGRAEPVAPFDTALGETHHLYPTFLPGGRDFVYYVNSRERGLYVASLDGRARTRLFDPDPSLPAGAAATPGVYADGHLLYVRDRVLMARPFDLQRRTAANEAFTVAETVDYEPPGQAAFSVANNVLVLRAEAHRPLAELAWVTRAGEPSTSVPSPPGTFRTLALSPDGRTLAIDRRDPQGLPSVWFVDTTTGTSTRLTAAYWASDPLWSADGRLLAYSIAVDSPPNLVIRDNQGRGAERRVTNNSAEQHYANSFTPDGRTLVYHAISPTTGTDLYVVNLAEDDSAPQRLLQTRANEHSARVSPDGRWVAYVSDESGQQEIYLARFPELQGARRVSSGGGLRPAWRRDGRELFYLAPGGRVMAMAFDGTTAASGGTELFRSTLYADAYAIDGSAARVLLARPAAAADVVPLEIITNPLH
jgi:Tol biopolymer transport system component/tRNA A-37 threonylcarbamoyl transferase component Bud32